MNMTPHPLPLTVYGGDDCDDTERVTARLRQWGIPFRETVIENDPDAERFVIFINGGYCSTPTLVFGSGNYKLILTEPTDEELRAVLREAGYHPAEGAMPE